MSNETNKVIPLGVNVIRNVISQIAEKKGEVKTTKPSDETLLAPTTKKNRPGKQVEPELSPFELQRQINEASRRETMQAAVGLLVSRSLIKGLEKISKTKSDNSLGFRPSKEGNVDNFLIKNIADGLIQILDLYPSHQNMEVAKGFIEMVEIIDELEKLGSQDKEIGLGFKPSVKEKEASLSGPIAISYAKQLRAQMPYLLEWLEIPVIDNVKSKAA